MHKKVVLAVLLLLLIAAAIVIYFLPLARSADYSLIVQAPKAVVRQKLLSDTIWQKWRFSEIKEPDAAFTITPDKANKALNYTFYNGGNTRSKGAVVMTESLDGGTFLNWHEEIQISSGLISKLKILLVPGGYATDVQRSIQLLKNDLEKPAEEEGGFRFKIYKVKAHAIAALSDTVHFSGAEEKMLDLYNAIKSKFDMAQLHDTTRFTSRFSLLKDSVIQLQVGVRLVNATTYIPAPLKRLEVPSILILVTSAKAHYEQIDQVKQAAYEWEKSYNLKLATQPWFEHNTVHNNGQEVLSDTLRMVQPFYYWPHPIEAIY